MKKVILVAILATLATATQAGEDSTERWFGDGLAWYEHPCGLSAFAKYGNDDSPDVRRAYFLTKHEPALCSKLFP
jgi:hypothetical protein